MLFGNFSTCFDQIGQEIRTFVCSSSGPLFRFAHGGGNHLRLRATGRAYGTGSTPPINRRLVNAVESR